MLKKSKKAVELKTPKTPKAPKARKPVGAVMHFYNKISVAIVKFNKEVPAGTKLAFKGATTDFEEVAQSMQYEHQPIEAAPKGKQVGIKVKSPVREGDSVYEAE